MPAARSCGYRGPRHAHTGADVASHGSGAARLEWGAGEASCRCTCIEIARRIRLCRRRYGPSTLMHSREAGIARDSANEPPDDITRIVDLRLLLRGRAAPRPG